MWTLVDPLGKVAPSILHVVTAIRLLGAMPRRCDDTSIQISSANATLFGDVSLQSDTGMTKSRTPWSLKELLKLAICRENSLGPGQCLWVHNHFPSCLAIGPEAKQLVLLILSRMLQELDTAPFGLAVSYCIAGAAALHYGDFQELRSLYDHGVATIEGRPLWDQAAFARFTKIARLQSRLPFDYSALLTKLGHATTTILFSDAIPTVMRSLCDGQSERPLIVADPELQALGLSRHGGAEAKFSVYGTRVCWSDKDIDFKLSLRDSDVVLQVKLPDTLGEFDVDMSDDGSPVTLCFCQHHSRAIRSCPLPLGT